MFKILKVLKILKIPFDTRCINWRLLVSSLDLFRTRHFVSRNKETKWRVLKRSNDETSIRQLIQRVSKGIFRIFRTFSILNI